MSLLDRLRRITAGPKALPTSAATVGVDRLARPVEKDDDVKVLPHEPNRWQVNNNLTVGWRQRWRRTSPEGVEHSAPTGQPDPLYPNGMDMDYAGDHLMRCAANLPQFPGKIGLYEIRCTHCGISMALTSAGRPDDPRMARLPCWWGKGRQ